MSQKNEAKADEFPNPNSMCSRVKLAECHELFPNDFRIKTNGAYACKIVSEARAHFHDNVDVESSIKICYRPQ